MQHKFLNPPDNVKTHNFGLSNQVFLEQPEEMVGMEQGDTVWCELVAKVMLFGDDW